MTYTGKHLLPNGIVPFWARHIDNLLTKVVAFGVTRETAQLMY
jgi:hypothetical protein